MVGRLLGVLRIGGLFVVLQLPVLAATLLGGTGGALPLHLADNGGPALVAMKEIVYPLRQQLAGMLAVLTAGAGGLGLDNDAGGDVLELDG